MTQEEAKQRWCPWAASRHIQASTLKPPQASTYMGPANAQLSTVCLADHCMAWRWEREPYANAQPGETGSAAGSGYCGNAGRP